jgi:hypothetical protein
MVDHYLCIESILDKKYMDSESCHLKDNKET